MDRWLRLILRCYPHGFRTDFGEEALGFWGAQAREDRYRGPVGRTRFTLSLLGDAARLQIRTMNTKGWEGGMMGGWTTDLRHALRALAGAPLFTGMAVVTLALGIGSATSVFSVVEGVVLRPLPYPEAEHLVTVTNPEGKTDDLSWPDFNDWRDGAGDFLRLAAYTESEGTFTWEGGAEAITGARVTRDYFQVMGVQPQLGRTFTADEDRLDGPDVVILSHGMWVERFGADAGVVGGTVPIDGKAVPVVGVMPEGFDAPYAGVRYWEPLQDDELLRTAGMPTGRRSLGFLSVVGRTVGTLTPAQVQVRLQELARSVDEAVSKSADRYLSPVVVPMLDQLVGGVRSTLGLLLAAAGLVLLVAAVNVAGLALSRGAARGKEMAVRTALGAPRVRIVRQVLTESLLVSLAAGVLGLGVAWLLQRQLVALAPEGLPRLDTIRMDGATLGFGALVTAVSGLIFGILPAIRSSAAPVSQQLVGARGSSAGRQALRPQQVLVSVQVGVAVVLLTGAALLASSFARLKTVDVGFQADAITLASVSPDATRYATVDDVDAFYQRLLGEVRAIPGVVAASTTYSPPMVGSDFRTSVVPEGVDPESVARKDRTWVGSVVVGDGYFQANGVPLLAGRGFTSTDRLGEPLVAIVNETMARELWPDEDPLGKRFFFTGGIRGSMGNFDPAFFPREPFTVVGVARDVRRISLDEPPEPEYYRPHTQLPWAFQYLVVRTDRPVPNLAQTLREAVWGIDPTVPVRTVRALSDYVAQSAAQARFRTLLLGGFAGLTGLLAMVGLYAVMTLAVARRTREMGIRLALGAPKEQVVRGVLGGGLRLVAAGGAVGLIAAWYGSRLLAGMLYQVTTTDPLSYLAVVVATVLVAGLACWGPARRAGRVDPVQSLREE